MTLKRLILNSFIALSCFNVSASVIIDGVEYTTDTISVRNVGPGITHVRYRIPEIPLNINTLTMDMTQGYNRLELTQANDRLGSTETMANAYKRHKEEGKFPIAGANASFWCVSSEKPASDYVLGTPYGGSAYNGKIVTETNMYSNKWDGGPQWTGIVSVDNENKLWIDQFSWKGHVKYDKWTASPEIFQVNRMCNGDEVAMFNSFYGRERAFNIFADCVVVYCDLKEGETWGVNKEIKAVVKAKAEGQNSYMLGDYDLALSATTGYKAKFNELQVGDEIILDYEWTTLDSKETPNLENVVEGHSLILKNGELTNLNTDKGYCSMTYSRTAYGSTADRSKLFVIVVDMSTNEYGASAGCNTSVVSQILQQMGCSNLCSMDAGGSAQMMINGVVVNKTTEGTPRATANGMMLYSTAPRSSEITRLEFDDFNLKMPTNALFTPKMLGYNQYGDLVDEDVQGVTFSCSENLGKCEGNIMYANNAPGYGTLTANYNGIEVTRPLTTLSTAMSLRIKPTILIDGHRDYPVEISSTIGRKDYLYDPSIMTWEIEDPSVVQIVNGVMKGLKNGETKIRCIYGDFSDESVVKVEIPNAPSMGQDWSRWSLKGTGASNVSVDAQGALKFNYTGGRVASVKMSNETPFYSLPDKIEFEFTSTIPIEYITIDLRNATMTAPNNLKCMNGTVRYEAGETYHVDFDLSQLGDMKDLMNYPISAPSMTFYLPTTGIEKGEKTINIKKFDGVYNNYSSVELVGQKNNRIKIAPSIITDGSLSISSSENEAEVSIYSLSGNLMLRSNINTEGGCSTLSVLSLQAGMYLVKVGTNNQTVTQKIVIR